MPVPHLPVSTAAKQGDVWKTHAVRILRLLFLKVALSGSKTAHSSRVANCNIPALVSLLDQQGQVAAVIDMRMGQHNG